MGKELIKENKPALCLRAKNGGNSMKKNNYLLLLLTVSGLMVTVGQLKAPVYRSPYMEVDRILWDAVNGKKVNGFDFSAKPSFSSLTSEQINAYFAARDQAARYLFAHPSLYLTAEQLKAYNAAKTYADEEVATQEAAQKERDTVVPFPDYSKDCDRLQKQFSFLKTDSNWKQIRKFLDQHAGKSYLKNFSDYQLISTITSHIYEKHGIVVFRAIWNLLAPSLIDFAWFSK